MVLGKINASRSKIGSTINRRWISLLFGVVILWLGFTAPVNAAIEGTPATAVFAGGCFWCMEQPFDELPGVIDTTSGYTGGTVENPGYYQVSAGRTGHVEAVQVTYDPSQVSYETLLGVFWHNVDPVDSRGQFCDKGSQYQSAIFYQNEEQQSAAIASKAALSDSGQFTAEVEER